MLGSSGGGGCNGLVNQPRRTSVWTCLPGYRENLPRLNVSSSLHDKNTKSHLRINNHSGFGEKKSSCVSICSQYKISSLVFFGNSLQVVSSGTGRPTNPKVFTLSFLEKIWKKSCARYQMFILFLYIQQWAWLSPLVFYFLDAISVCWMVVQT